MHELTMDLIGEDGDVTGSTEGCNMAEFFLSPHAAGRVMRIAEKEEARVFAVEGTFQGIEIDGIAFVGRRP